MKKSEKALIGAVAAVCFLALPLAAQGNKKIIDSLAKGMGKAAPEQLSKISAANAQKLGQVTGVGSSVAAVSAANSLQISESFPTVSINPTVARFVNSNKKTLYRLQTSIGLSARKAVENLHRWGAKPSKKPRRPRLLPEQAFTVQDFTALKYTGSALPQLPVYYHPNYMFRGMGLPLNGAAVRNILQNGLLLKDVGPNNNDLRMAYASAGGMGTMRAIVNERVINLTNAPRKALHYALRHNSQGMAVLVTVKEPKERGSIIAIPYDIPASKIERLIALLQIDGQPMWCQIELAPNGFLVTPYSSPQGTKEP